MGEIVEFPSNGTTGQGYLATPEGGSGPGLVVIQEWWGLVPHIKDVCDRLAREGFVALAPDLYHGKTVSEPDEAGKEMMALNLEKAGKDMSGAVDYVRDRAANGANGIGVIGFCMGGGLAYVIACQRPDAVKAITPFYGVIAWPGAEPDYSNMAAAVQGHYAADDGFFTPDKVHDLEARLKDLGKDVEMFVYPGADHAFFNDTRPEVYNAEAATTAWERSLAFFRSRLG
jgi:carboxymethylenebutenolidase